MSELAESDHDFAEEFLTDCTRSFVAFSSDERKETCEGAQIALANIVGVLTAVPPPEVTEKNFGEWEAISRLLTNAYGARQCIRELLLREQGHGPALDELIDELEAIDELEDASVH